MKELLIRMTKNFSVLVARPFKDVNTDILALAIESKKNFEEFKKIPIKDVYSELSRLVEIRNDAI